MKHYDKLFFIVGLAVAVASFGHYFYNGKDFSAQEKEAREHLSKSPTGEPWKNLEVPVFKVQTIEWPEIVPQDEEGKWFFQVFTPPQIWVDKDGNFITESPYVKESQKKSFPLRYAGVSNDPYRIQYKGYLGSEKDPVVQLEDSVTGEGYMGMIGKEITVRRAVEGSTMGKEVPVGLVVKSFDKKTIKNEDNTNTDIFTVVLDDKNIGKEVTIYSNKPTVISDEKRMTFTVDGKPWHVKKAGESATFKDAVFTVKSIDMEGGSAVVEMVPNDNALPSQTMKVSEKGIESVDNK